MLGYFVCNPLYVVMGWVQVPGHKGNFVYIKDAFYKKPDLSVLPFPTYFASVDDDTSPLIAELGETDPYLQE